MSIENHYLLRNIANNFKAKWNTDVIFSISAELKFNHDQIKQSILKIFIDNCVFTINSITLIEMVS